MTVKEASILLDKELSAIYPNEEKESIIFLIFNHLLGFKKFENQLKAGMEIPELLKGQIYDIIEQLKQHKPIQYVIGETEFYGMPFYVDQSVLIPRPETEELVQWILKDMHEKSPRIVDIGTGSGCIAVSLSKNLPEATVIGIDISNEALATAEKNAERNDCEVYFMNTNILEDNLPDLGLFDVVVSNPPYVTHEESAFMEKNVLENEPHVALFVPENDPFIFYRAIGKLASKQLKKDGYLYFEINESYPQEIGFVLAEFGFLSELGKDIHGKYRMLRARFA